MKSSGASSTWPATRPCAAERRRRRRRIRRLWPTADTAWSVHGVAGPVVAAQPERGQPGGDRARGDHDDPVAGGAERRRPRRRAWRPRRVVDARRRSSVSDDVPILATTAPDRLVEVARPGAVGLVVEAQPADVHDVAVAGAGPGQRLVDAELLRGARWAYVERLDVGEVGQGDGPLGLRGRCTTKLPSSSRSMRTPSGIGPVHDERPRAPARPRGRLAPRRRMRAHAAGARPSPVTAEITSAGPSTRPRAGSAVGHVGPRADDDAGPARAGRAGSAPSSSSSTRSCSAGRRAPSSGGQVDQQHQHPGPLDVAQELVAEALALAGALDEAGDVGDDELVAVVEAHHAEVGLERGERVVGDLGLGRGDPGDERGLAHVREADEGDVGHELELEAQPALLAVLALLGERRGPAPVGQEPGVALAAPAARGRQPAVAVRARGRRAPRRHWSCTTVPSGTCTIEVVAAVAVLLLARAVGAARRPAGAGGRGTRAARPRCGRPPARRRRPCRRRRRRDRPWPRAPRAGTTTQPAPPSPPSHVELTLVDEAGHDAEQPTGCRGRSLRRLTGRLPCRR